MRARACYRLRTWSTFLWWCSLLACLLPSLLLSQETNGQPVNLAVSVEGKVSIKRSGWSSSAPVIFGTSVSFGDLLQLDEHAKIKIVCSDLTLHDVDAAKAGVPCVTSQPLLVRPDNSLINPTREWTTDRSFPMVLSPRKTKLITGHPLLRWTPVDGVAVYRVIVRGMGLDWTTQTRSTTTELVYPDHAPVLKAGVDYKLIVESGGHSSSAEPGFGLGFSILDSAARNSVLREERRIVNLGLPREATEFLVAHLYSAYGLKAEAIGRLEALSLTFKEPAIIRLLANLYLEVGVVRKAETLYLESLILSQEQNDQEGQMVSHLALANIYEKALGNKKSASDQWRMSLALAGQLGDDKTIKQATNKLAELNNPVSSN